jgi:UDP-N-acetylglucosamine 2-epimerase (non-hydrolysing)
MRPVAQALQARGIVPTVVFTDQHPLVPEEFGLAGYPFVRLACAGQADPHAHVQAVTGALQALLQASHPNLLIVQGDTSSALGAALAGFLAGVPVAHVEAGLRTHDPFLPWPEEEYRTAIDADAELLFAPTETAAANLRAEKVSGEIHVTGNTSIDAVLEAERRLPPPLLRETAMRQILVTCHRRESWNEGLGSIAAALAELASAGGIRVHFVLHPNRFVSGEMQRLLAELPGIELREPCSHEQLLLLMRESDLVLSDSGGIQEEAPALGVPLLVLRDKTERPEGIAAGAAILVGTDSARIVSEARRLLRDPVACAAMSRRLYPFGDGHAGERIGGIIVDWLERRSLTRRRA